MALSATQVWEVRTTGNDANGGAFRAGATGTDYSQQDAPQVTYTDLTTGASSSQVTSATSPFTAAHVGNVLNIPTATPSGVVAGRYEILSVASGVATLDRSAGTANAGGATGYLGGALASPGQAASQIVAGNTVWIRSGTYLLSATANVPGGKPQAGVQSRWVGYVAARGDAVPWGAMPVLRANASSMTVFSVSNQDVSVENLELDGNSGAFLATNGLQATSGFRIRAWNVRARNCASYGFGPSGMFHLYFCEANGSGNTGIYVAGFAFGCLARGGGGHGFAHQNGGSIFVNCAAFANTGDGFSNVFPLNCVGCVSYANGVAGFRPDLYHGVLMNCVAWGNSDYAFATSQVQPSVLLVKCAAGSNTAGTYNTSQIPAANVTGPIALSANPFVGAPSLNFAPNAVSGGGASLRGAGFGLFPAPGTAGAPDVGASQHADLGGTNVSFFEG